MMDHDTNRILHQEFNESMTVDQLRTWLERNGIPEEFCQTFEDNFIDGTEFKNLSPEEVNKMIPPIGLAKKIIRMLPKVSLPSTPVQPLSSPVSPSPLTPTSASYEGSCSSMAMSTSRSDRIPIPDHWREDTESCIEEGVLDDSSRSDIVRTLVTLLVAKYGPKPGKTRCEEMARQLILKHPFMKDDLGTGYASWVAKMMECIENRIKQSRKKLKKLGDEASPNPKRARTSAPKDDLMRRYPVRVHETGTDDSRSVAEHNKALHEEMKKAKPRDAVILPLMKSTYHDRRLYIQNDARTVVEILELYPALCRPAVIEQDMDTIIGRKDIRATFEKTWSVSFVPGLLQYGQRSNKTAIKDIMKRLVQSDDTSRQKTALAVLVASMKCTGEKGIKPLSYLYEEHDLTKTPEDVCKQTPELTSPRIASFVGEESVQYFVLVEGKVLCQVPTMQQALFVTFSAYYVFHLEYPKQVKNALFFLQDYVLAFPDSLRRSAVYLATASDINKLSMAQ